MNAYSRHSVDTNLSSNNKLVCGCNYRFLLFFGLGLGRAVGLEVSDVHPKGVVSCRWEVAQYRYLLLRTAHLP